MKNKKIDWTLFFICLFLGWFGIDKLYKRDTKLFIIKFALLFILVGAVWNIYDIICVLLGKYKLNPLK